MSKSVSREAYSKKLEEMLGEWKSYGAVSTPQKVVEQMIDLKYKL